MGTPGFMAPEQRDHPETADGRADVYSLGVTLHYLLAGFHPATAPLPVSVPASLVAVIQAMRDPAPEGRYPRVVEVAAALAPFVRGATPAPRPAPPPPVPSPSQMPTRANSGMKTEPPSLPTQTSLRPRRRWLALSVLALALLAAGTTAYLTLRGPRAGAEMPDGTVVLEFPDGLPDDAEVLVDGIRATVSRRGDKEAEVTVPAGAHEIVVRAGGKEFRAREKVAVPGGGKAPAVTVALADRAAPPDDRPALGDDKPGPILNMSGHSRGCIGMAFGAEGLTAVSHDRSRYHFWDLTKRREVSSWDGSWGGGRPIYSPLVPVLMPGGVMLTANGGDGQIEFVSVNDGKRVGGPLKNGRPVHAVALSPDGKKILSADSDGLVRVWDRGSGKTLNEFKHGTSAVAIAFSPDGKHILTGCADKVVRLYNLEKDSLERSFDGHGDAVVLVGFSRGGGRVISVANEGLDHTLRIWDAGTGQELHKLDVGGRDGNALASLALAADSTRVLTGHFDGTVKLWDLTTLERVVTYSKHGRPVVAVAISPDGHHALSASDNYENHVWLYRLPPRKK
jgi:hypothetical protein